MKIKVSEASGPVLDWMVAKCLGTDFVNGDYEYATISDKVWARGGSQERRYSTDWSQGGPIIEREGIDLWCNVPSGIAEKHDGWSPSWRACLHRCGVGTEPTFGPTPLIAAMRCFVTSKLGDEVDVPGELV